MRQNNQVSKLILVFLAAAFLIFIPNSMSAKVLNPMLNSHGSNVKNNYASIPLFFEANHGQVQKEVKFLARGHKVAMFLTKTEVILSFTDAPFFEQKSGINEPHKVFLKMKFINPNPDVMVAGIEKLPGISNYYPGKNTEKWITDVSQYAKVKYSGIYHGVDLIYYANQNQLEYDFIVFPGGVGPDGIAVQFEGAHGMEIDKHGELVLSTSVGLIQFQKPFAYQEEAGGQKKAVESRYVFKGKGQVGFALTGDYDRTKPVVIDPKLKYPFVYFTYLGGKGNYEEGEGIAADTGGNVYVTGRTISKDFPTTAGAHDTSCGTDGQCNNLSDAFVAKLNAAGSGLVYATYLGGASYDEGQAIAVDSSGNAYATGWTQSADFPTTSGAFQPKNGETIVNQGQVIYTVDAFVTKLDCSAKLV